MWGPECSATLSVSKPPKVGCLVAVGAKCPGKGTQRSSLCHRDCSRGMYVREMYKRPFGLTVVYCTWKGEVQQVLGRYHCLQQ